MNTVRRKYAESHWLVFAILGVVTFLAGLYLMFSSSEDVAWYISMVGYLLMGLAIVQIINIVYRKRRQHGWGVPLGIGLFEFGVGLILVMTTGVGYEFHIAVMALYVIVRSVSSIVSGFTSFSNPTDKFMWIVYGIVGSVLGCILLADPGVSKLTFIQVFATFLLIAGQTNLLYGVHAKDELAAAYAARKVGAGAAKKSSAKTKKKGGGKRK